MPGKKTGGRSPPSWIQRVDSIGVPTDPLDQ